MIQFSPYQSTNGLLKGTNINLKLWKLEKLNPNKVKRTYFPTVFLNHTTIIVVTNTYNYWFLFVYGSHFTHAYKLTNTYTICKLPPHPSNRLTHTRIILVVDFVWITRILVIPVQSNNNNIKAYNLKVFFTFSLLVLYNTTLFSY